MTTNDVQAWIAALYARTFTDTPVEHLNATAAEGTYTPISGDELARVKAERK